MLWIRNGRYIKYIPKHYRNATTVFITSRYYFLNLEKYKKLNLTELNYNGGMESVLNQSGSQNFMYNTQLKQLLKNITSLTTDKIDNHFIDFVLPNIPRKIKSICLFSRDFEFKSIEFILTNFQNLQDLRLFTDLCQQDLLLFQNHMFNSLKTLYLNSFTSYDKFNINFNHFPVLTKLHLDYVRNLYLHGISNLTFLELNFIDLKCINSFGNIAPKLRILIL
ncbi:hypothetical protein K502DRAFT_349583 [Neoconidiobolus thromboides FSU 785]|nr:hypothetical protein K502DRAFT_349583 [Neoconidiobolus thromboides FSU 785]